jgi:lipid-binding SYLF domain-containing protein
MRILYVLIAVLAFGVVLLGASPGYASMQGDVDQAATIIERFQAVPEKAIPQAVLKDARGLAIMTVIKAGFGISGRGGTGVLVSRTRNGWSGHRPLAPVVGFGPDCAEGRNSVMVLHGCGCAGLFARRERHPRR